MFKISANKLVNFLKCDMERWMETFDSVLTDCDGVLWHNSVAIPDAADAINALLAASKRVFFVTNNSTTTRDELWRKANRMGFNISVEDIIAPAYSIAQYLRNRQFTKKVYLIGNPAMVKEFDAVNIQHFGVGPDLIQSKIMDYFEREISMLPPEDVGAVVVGYDVHFSYGKMMKASHFLTANENCLFLTTNVDPVHKYPQYHLPGTGAILKGLESCVGREAMQFGKPEPNIVLDMIHANDLKPERTLMIGDCCNIDVSFGRNCGFQTLLVGTGAYQLEDVREMLKDPVKNQKFIPDVYLPTIGDMLQCF